MVRPILFNGDMVRAILERRKTVTRRVIKDTDDSMYAGLCGLGPGLFDKKTGLRVKEPYYRLGDILYVRETWGFNPCTRCADVCKTPAPDTYKGVPGCFVYRTDYGTTEDDTFPPSMHKWHPSIHMPKEAARIWLKVTNVRVERIQDMRPVDVVNEGAYEDCWDCLNAYGESGTQCCYQKEDECSQCDSVIMEWERLWNSTIKKSDLAQYSWTANPWVWVIEFERCGKPEEAEG